MTDPQDIMAPARSGPAGLLKLVAALALVAIAVLAALGVTGVLAQAVVVDYGLKVLAVALILAVLALVLGWLARPGR